MLIATSTSWSLASVFMHAVRDIKVIETYGQHNLAFLQ